MLIYICFKKLGKHKDLRITHEKFIRPVMDRSGADNIQMGTGINGRLFTSFYGLLLLIPVNILLNQNCFPFVVSCYSSSPHFQRQTFNQIIQI